MDTPLYKLKWAPDKDGTDIL